MLKGFFCLSVFLGSSAGFATTFMCRSEKYVHVFYASKGQWEVEFSAPSDHQVDNLTMKTKEKSNLGVREAQVLADEGFVARNPKYMDFNRFNVSDAWCDYHLLMPKRLNTREHFTGLIYSRCKADDGGTYRISCQVRP